MCNGRSVRHTATSQPLSSSNSLAASTIMASVAGGCTRRLSTTSTRHELQVAVARVPQLNPHRPGRGPVRKPHPAPPRGPERSVDRVGVRNIRCRHHALIVTSATDGVQYRRGSSTTGLKAGAYGSPSRRTFGLEFATIIDVAEVDFVVDPVEEAVHKPTPLSPLVIEVHDGSQRGLPGTTDRSE